MEVFNMKEIKEFIFFVLVAIIIIFTTNSCFARSLNIINNKQAKVIVKELNVYDRLPVLVKTGFLKWSWKFGKVIYVLKKGDIVEILKTKMLSHYKWVKIKYRDRTNNEERVGWCYLGSDQSSFIPFIYAQTSSSPEEKEMQEIDLSSSVLVCLCLTFIAPFFIFKFLPTSIEKYKFIFSLFFDLVVLLVFGYVKSDAIFNIIKF